MEASPPTTHTVAQQQHPQPAPPPQPPSQTYGRPLHTPRPKIHTAGGASFPIPTYGQLPIPYLGEAVEPLPIPNVGDAVEPLPIPNLREAVEPLPISNLLLASNPSPTQGYTKETQPMAREPTYGRSGRYWRSGIQWGQLPIPNNG